MQKGGVEDRGGGGKLDVGFLVALALALASALALVLFFPHPGGMHPPWMSKNKTNAKAKATRKPTWGMWSFCGTFCATVQNRIHLMLRYALH